MSNVFHPYQLGDDFIEIADKSGKKWKLSPLTVGQRFRIQSRIRDLLPSPMQLYHEARRNEPPSVAADLFRVASKQQAFWPPAIEDCLVLICETPSLRAESMREMLVKYQPDTSLDEAISFADELANLSFVLALNFGVTGRRQDDPNRLRADQVTAEPTGSN